MKQIFHILKYKAVGFIRINSQLDFPTLFKNFGSGLIYIGFAVGSFFFTLKIIQYLLIEIRIGLFLLHEFISMVLFIFFISVNVGNIIVSYSTLYKSNEVVYLFTKPLEPSKVFLIKFLDNFFYSSSTLIMIMFSVIAGYAVYFNLSFTSLVILIVFNIIPFILSAGSLGVIILLLVIKLVSKYGVKKVIYTLVFSYTVVVFLFFKINSPIKLVNMVMKYYPIFDKDKYLSELVPSVIKFLPNNWLTETAYWTTLNHPAEALPSTLLQVGVSIVLFSTALTLGHKWYMDTWLKNLKITSDNIALRNNKTNILDLGRNSIFNPQTDSIIKKDILVFIREPSQVIHISILVFLIAIFVSSVAGIRYIKLGDHILITTIYLSILLFNLLLISTFSLRFIFPLISLEGESFWKIKSAPVDTKFYVWKKILPFGLIVFIIAQGLSFFANHRLGLGMVILSALITGLASISIIAINFGMGVLFANYKEKNPIRLSSSQGASISFLFNICYMLLVVILLFTPLTYMFYAIRTGQSFLLSRLFVPLLPLAIISLVTIYAFFKSGFKSLKKDF